MNFTEELPDTSEVMEFVKPFFNPNDFKAHEDKVETNFFILRITNVSLLKELFIDKPITTALIFEDFKECEMKKLETHLFGKDGKKTEESFSEETKNQRQKVAEEESPLSLPKFPTTDFLLSIKSDSEVKQKKSSVSSSSSSESSGEGSSSSSSSSSKEEEEEEDDDDLTPQKKIIGESKRIAKEGKGDIKSGNGRRKSTRRKSTRNVGKEQAKVKKKKASRSQKTLKFMITSFFEEHCDGKPYSASDVQEWLEKHNSDKGFNRVIRTWQVTNTFSKIIRQDGLGFLERASTGLYRVKVGKDGKVTKEALQCLEQYLESDGMIGKMTNRTNGMLRVNTSMHSDLAKVFLSLQNDIEITSEGLQERMRGSRPKIKKSSIQRILHTFEKSGAIKRGVIVGGETYMKSSEKVLNEFSSGKRTCKGRIKLKFKKKRKRSKEKDQDSDSDEESEEFRKKKRKKIHK